MRLQMKTSILVIVSAAITISRNLGISRLTFVRAIGLWAIRIASPMNVGGVRLFVLAPGDSSTRITLGETYEPEETALMASVIFPNDTVIDIGAHIGVFSVLFSNWAGSHGKVFSFEPEPGNLALLRRNLKYNQCENVEVIPAAVGSLNQPVALLINAQNSLDNRLTNDQHSEQAVMVESIQLDTLEILNDHRIDFIKMDIQGSEPPAVQGMKNILASQPTVKLLTEFWPYGLTQAGHDPQKFLCDLRSLGFHLYQVGGEVFKLSADNDENFLKSFPHDSRRHINIFATKDENWRPVRP
jgi:FkbM family methyltransferase